MPAPQTEKRICTHKTIQNPASGEFRAQVKQGIQRVVGRGRGFGRVDERNFEARDAFNCEMDHLRAVLKAGRRSLRFERLCAHWSKEHRIQLERRAGCLCHRQVTLMRRVKTPSKKRYAAASEKSDAPAGGWMLIHLPIVPCTVTLHSATWGPSASIRIDTMRYLIAILALAGVVVSALALQVHYSTATEPCDINAKWDCGIVNHSPFAVIMHVPVAAIGIAGYLAMVGLALFKRRRLLAALALCALGFSLYLTYVEKYVLEVFCIYCVTSLGIIALITLLSLWWAISGWREARSA